MITKPKSFCRNSNQLNDLCQLIPRRSRFTTLKRWSDFSKALWPGTKFWFHLTVISPTTIKN